MNETNGNTPILIGILQTLVGILAVVGTIGTILLNRRFKRIDDDKLEEEKQKELESRNIDGYIKSLRDDLEKLRDDLNAANDRITTLLEEREEILAKYGESKRAVDDLTWQLKRVEKEYANDKLSYADKIESLSRENEQLKTRCANCEAENKRLSDIIEAVHVGNYEKPV